METAQIARPIDGDKLYQQRARAALPILVRQAQAGSTLQYGELATELGMPNPRNLNAVLGSIGQSLKRLSKQWHEEIPPIQCLVVNKHTGLPGEGVGWFISDTVNFRRLPKAQQRRIVGFELSRVFAFSRWPEILDALGLEPAAIEFRKLLAQASRFRAGPESDEHRRLKEHVARSPQLLQLPTGITGQMEYALPSGDSIDVLFKGRHEWIAAEVKSRLSPESDIVRGFFQCVKYRALIEAYQASQGLPACARAVLVLETVLPNRLLPLKNLLGVELLERVGVPALT
ncbi:MAG: hypothetical protein KY476_08145 [Planctomycetes bacterium]|nr:hypothetical protein [Planctomycetota bacterium]